VEFPMVSVGLAPAEFAEVEFPCADSAESITLRVIGTVAVDVQASRDGMTWGTPVAQARLKTEKKTLRLDLPRGTRKIRALLHNATNKSAAVEISDPGRTELPDEFPTQRLSSADSGSRTPFAAK
jgi:hypothetical protein